MKQFATFGDFIFLEGEDRNQIIILRDPVLSEKIGLENQRGQIVKRANNDTEDLREEAC